MPSPQLLTLAQCTAILRGLLIKPTGNENLPYRTPFLYSIATAKHYEPDELLEEIRDTRNRPGSSHATLPPLRLKTPDIILDGDIVNTTRRAMHEALLEYIKEHSSRPYYFWLPGLGIIRRGEQLTQAEVIAEGLSPMALFPSIALVTGAAGAIGRGICRALLEAGACVIATDVSQTGLEDLAQAFSSHRSGRLLKTALMDVTDPVSVACSFERAVDDFGGIDIVIINAGIAHVAALTDLPLATFQKLEKVNVEGTLLTITEAARWMKLQNTGGDIVLISTKNVPSPSANFGAYSATKAAAHQLARIASLKLAPFDIRVNMVAPDGVFSDDDGKNEKVKSGLWATVGPDRMKARGLDEEGLEEYYRNRNLLKARVTARHVANAVMFFVTRQTPTTGATIPVDGGLPDATPR